MNRGDKITFPFGTGEKEGIVEKIYPNTVYIKVDFPKHKGKIIKRSIASLNPKAAASQKKEDEKKKKAQRKSEKKRRQLKNPLHENARRSSRLDHPGETYLGGAAGSGRRLGVAMGISGRHAGRRRGAARVYQAGIA